MQASAAFFLAGAAVGTVIYLGNLAVIKGSASSPSGSATLAAGGQRAASPSFGTAGPVDAVILVDESGSQTPAEVAEEKAATSEIASSLLYMRSRVTVIGFGGVNHVAPDQNPVDVACEPTIASPADYSYLTNCVNSLHRRTEAEGDDTDYAAALSQAMSYFNPQTAAGKLSPPSATKVMLMMTDGPPDVHSDTQQYGSNWQLGELTQIDDQLAIARSEHVQFWALGFGTDIGTNVDGTSITQVQALAYLNAMAAKGAPAACDGHPAPIQPHAQWAENPDDAFTTLGQLNADATCAGYNTSQVPVGGGATVSLTVQIPRTASSGAISVDRGNPEVQVTFTQPDGRPWADSPALSGQDTSPVETLHLPDITSGEAGTWTINLTAPTGLASEVVSASALWQGAIRAEISASPTTAKLGQPICSVLSLLGPHGPVTNSAGLGVSVTASGDGLSQRRVPVTSGGQAGCLTTGPGQYAGTITAPDTPGTATFAGIAVGYGLFVTYVPATVTVGTAEAPFTAVIMSPAGRKIQAGSSLPVEVLFTDNTGTAQRVLVKVSGDGTSPSIGGTSSELTVPGGSETAPLSVIFPANSTTGLTSVQVTVVDATTPRKIIASASFDVTVVKPPGFLAKWLWFIIGVTISLVLIILAILMLRARRRRKSVRDLIATLSRDGNQLGRSLRAPDNWSDVFTFVIRDESSADSRLDFPLPRMPVYEVRRSSSNMVRLLTPVGDSYDIVVGGPRTRLEHNGLELAFRDARPKSTTARA